MKIDGQQIAETIYENLRQRVAQLQEQGATPHLVDILVDIDAATEAYVKQKQLQAEGINAKVTLDRYPASITTEELLQKIDQLNKDPNVHGVIIQRPLPNHIDQNQIDQAVISQKDIDGFRKDSPFAVPVALAVEKILRAIYKDSHPGVHEEHDRIPSKRDSIASLQNDKFLHWIKNKNIIVIGKGKTAGNPIRNHLANKLVLQIHGVDRETPNPDEIIKQGDIVISAVGKPDIVRPDNLKREAIAIGVGLYQSEDGKLRGDYKSKEIQEVASFYTPVVGGVGPVNVACLMENLVTAAERQNSLSS